jgi:hypothetical protein
MNDFSWEGGHIPNTKRTINSHECTIVTKWIKLEMCDIPVASFLSIPRQWFQISNKDLCHSAGLWDQVDV